MKIENVLQCVPYQTGKMNSEAALIMMAIDSPEHHYKSTFSISQGQILTFDDIVENADS